MTITQRKQLYSWIKDHTYHKNWKDAPALKGVISGVGLWIVYLGCLTAATALSLLTVVRA